MSRFYFGLLLLVLPALSVQSQPHYIYQVLEYTPAPGQFINKGPAGLPESAQSIVGTLTGMLSLGAWGGYVVFRFEHPVQNHPDHPFGVDFIIFGNPLETWSEPATVWVMKDENQNGLPDDTWYQLAGSDYFFSSTHHNYQVTYFNPHTEAAADVPWEDNLGNEGFVFAKSMHTQPYYPDAEIFPHIPSDHYTLAGTRIAGAMDHSNPAFIKSFRRAFGYADNTPRGQAPFHVPANPYTSAIENGGGDGFDISWAVDAQGNYVELDEIHFIKVQTAMLDDGGWLGEVSTEITGAVMVEPNSSITGILDRVVVKDLPRTLSSSPYPLEAFAFHRGRWQPQRTIQWSSNLPGAWVDENNQLHFDVSGELILTAFLQENPDISAQVSVLLDPSTHQTEYTAAPWARVFPNPASGYVNIELEEPATIRISDLNGKVHMSFLHPSGLQRVGLEHFQAGVYFLSIVSSKGTTQQKILIR